MIGELSDFCSTIGEKVICIAVALKMTYKDPAITNRKFCKPPLERVITVCPTAFRYIMERRSDLTV